MPRLAPGQDGLHPTYCRLCEALCGLVVKVEDGRITHVGPDRAHPVSEGHLCVKGPAMAHVAYDPDRVLQPLKRVGGPGEFEPVSWDEALADIATRVKAAVARHGADSLGLYVGNPASFAALHFNFAAGFVAAFGSSKLYSTMHVDTAAKMLASELIYGGAMPVAFPDIERCDFLLILGANPMISHMSLISEPLARKKLDEIHKRQGVVVVDPRRTETAQRYEHLPILPDSDAWLLGALLNVIFEEGLAREQLLDARVDGWRPLREAVREITPEAASARCRAPAETIRALARRFAAARSAACYGRVGTNRGSFSTLANVFIEALNLVTGRFGEPGGWVMGEPAVGAARARSPYGSRHSRISGIPLLIGMASGGELAQDILTPGEGQIRALFIDSGNPVLSHPQGRRTEAALEGLDLLVCLDFYVTETSRHADYLLPAVTFFEHEDLNDSWAANAPRPYLQYTDAAIPPRGDSRHSYDIYGELLERAGLPPTFAPTANRRPAFFDVLAAGFATRSDGLTLETLANDHPHGLRLAQNVDAQGTWDRITHPDKRPKLWHAVVEAETARLKASLGVQDGRLRLFGRRKLRSMNSWMHNDLRIVRSDRPTLLIHPQDALDRRIADGQLVRVSSDKGDIEVRAQISEEVIAGSVNYPHGWGHRGGWRTAAGLEGADVNELASSDPEDWEQVSGVPLLDGIPVEVTPLTS